MYNNYMSLLHAIRDNALQICGLQPKPRARFQDNTRLERILEPLAATTSGRDAINRIKSLDIPIYFSETLPDNIQGQYTCRLSCDGSRLYTTGDNIQLNARLADSALLDTLVHEARHALQSAHGIFLPLKKRLDKNDTARMTLFQEADAQTEAVVAIVAALWETGTEQKPDAQRRLVETMTSTTSYAHMYTKALQMITDDGLDALLSPTGRRTIFDSWFANPALRNAYTQRAHAECAEWDERMVFAGALAPKPGMLASQDLEEYGCLGERANYLKIADARPLDDVLYSPQAAHSQARKGIASLLRKAR